MFQWLKEMLQMLKGINLTMKALNVWSSWWTGTEVKVFVSGVLGMTESFPSVWKCAHTAKGILTFEV